MSDASDTSEKPDREDAHTVESDLYDRAAIARIRKASTAWQQLDEEGGRLVPHFDALLDDVFCALFKYNVVPLDAEQTPPSSALNRKVVAELIEGQAYPALRPETLLDEAHAGLATVSIGESLLKALKEDRVLTSGDLLDLWKLAQQEEEVREAEERAEVAEDLAASEEAGTEAEPEEFDDSPEDTDLEVVDEDDLERDTEPVLDVDAEERTDLDEGEGTVVPTAVPPGETAGEETAEGEDAGEGVPSGEPSAMREAATAAKKAARVAAAQQRQKQRHVDENLERVASRLEKSILGAGADAATKVEDLPDALSSWGQGLGAGGKLDAGQRIDLGRRLADNKKLQKLAKVFGRMRENALAVRRKVLDRADQEMFEVGRHRSLDDIARLVPHELVQLNHPLLKRDFQRRLLDGGLLTYSLKGVDTHGHGPIVVCLDTSSSMSGDKEIWSKAVTLTFVEIARRQRRRCHVVCFADASALKEFDMNPRTHWQVALDETMNLAEHFSGGGTDFMAPLDAAMEKLSTRELRKADIVLITDGECAVDAQWRDAFHRAKRKKNFSLYAILVDRGSARSDTVEDLADRISRVSELTEDGGEIFSRSTDR